jgi:hypothetical protein
MAYWRKAAAPEISLQLRFSCASSLKKSARLAMKLPVIARTLAGQSLFNSSNHCFTALANNLRHSQKARIHQESYHE